MRYKYDENNIFIQSVINNDDLKNTTNVRPKDGLYKAVWTGTEWIEGATEEEIKAFKEENNIIQEPTEQEKIISNIMLENAELKQQIAEITLQLAELKGDK